MSEVASEQDISTYERRKAEFFSLYNELLNKGQLVQSQYPELMPAYKQLMATGETAKKYIVEVESAIKSGKEAVESVTTYTDNLIDTVDDAVDDAGEYLTDIYDSAKNEVLDFFGLGSLGVLPLIPIAIIAAATAYIGGWVSDAYTINQKLSTAEKIIEQGGTREEAKEYVNSIANSGSFLAPANSAIKNLIPLFLIGSVGLYFYTTRNKQNAS